MLQIERDSYPLKTGDDARVKVDRVEEIIRPDGTAVSVVLSWDGAEHVGHAAGGPERQSRDFLVAEATLHAIAAVQGSPAGFTIQDLSITRAGGVDVMVAVVAEDDNPQRPLVGTAVLDRDNDHIGAVRAVLDAVNRRLSERL